LFNKKLRNYSSSLKNEELHCKDNYTTMKMLLYFIFIILLFACENKVTINSPNIIYILADDLGWGD